MQVERSIIYLYKMLSGERVSNAWTICPQGRDNTLKEVLIPDRHMYCMVYVGKAFEAVWG